VTDRLGVWWIAEDRPDLPAVVEAPSGPRTFGELTGRAHRIVHALRAAGLRLGDSVAALLPNDTTIIEWWLACQEAGWRYVLLNTHLSADEIAGVLAGSETRALIGHEQFTEVMCELSERSGLAATAVVGTVDGMVSEEQLLDGFTNDPPEKRAVGQLYPFSSGTTGKPKGIRRPDAQGDPSERANAEAVFGKAFAFEPLSGVHLCSAGMHHGGAHAFYMGALNAGQALVILPRFDPEAVLAAIETHRVTTAYMVPTMFHRLLDLPEETKRRYDVSTLEVVAHGAAPCPKTVKQRMMDWWGPVIWETYGGMEGAATIAKPHRWLEKPGTVGRSVRGVTIEILDDDGNPLPPGEVGHIFLDMGRRTFEYVGDDAQPDPDRTDEVHRGTRFTLGDIGYLDDDGYLFISDRAKDMIITGGVNVYPLEVEEVLGDHPSVGDCAVIGLPDEEWGEIVTALVVPVDGVEPTEELADALVAYCRENLAAYKCPKAVRFRDSLPRTDTGKLFKRHLRAEYAI